MKGRKTRWIAAGLAAASFLLAAPLQGAESLLDAWRMNRITQEGSAAFHEGRYERARSSYMQAQDLTEQRTPESFRLHFNIGNTFYKEGNYDQAEKEFQQALASEDVELRSRTYYNLGNVYFQKGLAAQDIKQLEEAVSYYQKALELNPNDDEAKFNIEVVRRLIKMKKEQSPSPTCNQNQGAGQQQQPSAGQQNQSEEKKEESGQEQAPPEQPPQTGQPPPAAADTTTGPEKQIPEPPQTPAGSTVPPPKISADEARRLLQAIREKEQDDLKNLMNLRTAGRPPREKDW